LRPRACGFSSLSNLLWKRKFVNNSASSSSLNPLRVGRAAIAALAAAGAVIAYYLKKPKEQDLLKIVKKLQQRFYVEQCRALDITEFQAIPITENITNIYLPYEAITFEVSNNVLKGLQIRHLYKVTREQEKSRLFSESLKYLGAKQQIKQQANLFGVDVENLGLE